jgi:hypothetical protein
MSIHIGGVNEPRKLVQARLVKLVFELKLEPSSRSSLKTVFELSLYINRAESELAHEALNKI